MGMSEVQRSSSTLEVSRRRWVVFVRNCGATKEMTGVVTPIDT